jgi:hypothetical protein
MIDPATIPRFTGDEDVIERAAAALMKAARGIAHVGAAVDRSWQGMNDVYEAPEASTLFAASAPIRDRAAELGDDIEAVAQALKTYAAEVRPIAEDLRFTTSIIEGLVEHWRNDPDWRKEDINVSEHNNLLRQVDVHLAALMAAERKAANTINALIGMPQYHQAGAEGPEEYTYGFDPAQVDPNAERPWGEPVEEEFPWWRDAWNETYAFGKGVAWDGAVQGDARGLLNIAGFWGQDGSVWSFGTLFDTWVGLSKLGMIVTQPVFLPLNMVMDTPGLKKGEGAGILLGIGKGLLAWDKWGKGNNAEAAGEAVYNVVSVATIFTKVGTAGKAASGAADAAHLVDEVADAGGDAARASHTAEAARATESMRTAEPITDLSQVVAPSDRALPNLRGVLETTRDFPWAERGLRWNLPESGLSASDLPMETLPDELTTPREARPASPDAEPPAPSELASPRTTPSAGPMSAHTAPPKTQLDGLLEKLENMLAKERVREPALAGARHDLPHASGSGDTPHLSAADAAKASEATPGHARGSGEGGRGEGGSPASHADDGIGHPGGDGRSPASHDAPPSPPSKGERSDPSPTDRHEAPDGGHPGHPEPDGDGRRPSGLIVPDSGVSPIRVHGPIEPPHTPLPDHLAKFSGIEYDLSLLDYNKRSNHPSRKPWQESPLTAAKDTPEPLSVPHGLVRTPGGIIYGADGRPLAKYIEELLESRAEAYVERRQKTPLEFSRNTKVGPVLSIVFDRLTGIPYETTNKLVHDRLPLALHPVLRETFDLLTETAESDPRKYYYGPDKPRMYGGFPHWEPLGIHSEVQGINRALFDREAMGFTVSRASLVEFLLDNRFPFSQGRIRVACCPNCTALLGEAESLAGKLRANRYEVTYTQWTKETRK